MKNGTVRVCALLGGLAGGSWLALEPVPVSAACSNDSECSGGPARIMVILDASSTMLNVGGGAGAQGATDWDQFRVVVAGSGDSFYDSEVEPSGPVASQVAHVGLIAFGDQSPDPGEQKLVVDYGPCTEPNLRWALDPETSCDEPGCTDPWGGPPIEWTFKDGSAVDPPNFALETLSHMPACEGGGPDCAGSLRFTHLGIELATQHQADYVTFTPFTADDTTLYVNILVTDGQSDSTPAQVQAALEDAYAEGITTYVVGLGEAAQMGSPQFQAELDDMAGWGSNGTETAYVAANQGELVDALRDIVSRLAMPCCKSIDCSEFGGADSGGTDDGAAEWGSADGSGSAEGTSGDAGAEGFDDDGGCTCRAGAGSTGGAILFALGAWAGRRRRGA